MLQKSFKHMEIQIEQLDAFFVARYPNRVLIDVYGIDLGFGQKLVMYADSRLYVARAEIAVEHLYTIKGWHPYPFIPVYRQARNVRKPVVSLVGLLIDDFAVLRIYYC